MAREVANSPGVKGRDRERPALSVSASLPPGQPGHLPLSFLLRLPGIRLPEENCQKGCECSFCVPVSRNRGVTRSAGPEPKRDNALSSDRFGVFILRERPTGLELSPLRFLE